MDGINRDTGLNNDMNAGRILIIDDEPMNLILMEGLLEDDFSVHALDSAQEALALCRASPMEIDAVVSDVLMPGMTGYELCQALRADVATANIPVLLVSSLDDEAAITAGFEAGATDLLNKPFSPEIMLNRVGNLAKLTRLSRLLKEAGVEVPA